MQTLLKFIRGSFFRLLRRYPRQFRNEFEDEMRVTFDDRVREAAGRGARSVVAAWLREMVSLPLSILKEFWHQHERREMIMTTGISTEARSIRRGTWRQVLLAVFPHLAFALFVGRGAFLQDKAEVYSRFNIYIGIPLLIGFIAAAFYAWRQDWPRWSASWFGYWAWIWFTLFANGMSFINAKLGLVEDWVLISALLAAMLLLLVTGLFSIFRADQLKGLLAVSFLMPVGLPMTVMEFVPNRIEGLLTLGSGLSAALCAAWIIRRGEWRSGLWAMLGGNLLIGIAYAYVQTYWLEYPQPFTQNIQPSDFFVTLLIFILVSAVLIAGPWIFWNAWDFGKRRLGA